MKTTTETMNKDFSDVLEMISERCEVFSGLPKVMNRYILSAAEEAHVGASPAGKRARVLLDLLYETKRLREDNIESILPKIKGNVYDYDDIERAVFKFSRKFNDKK